MTHLKSISRVSNVLNSATEYSDFACAVSFDVSKAFDSLNLNVLPGDLFS